jgi:CRP-like cAMP-binding protein
VVGPGTTLGEMESVDGQPASATVVVDEDAEMVEFGPTVLRDLLQRRPALGYRVMCNMARKISVQLGGQE